MACSEQNRLADTRGNGYVTDKLQMMMEMMEIGDDGGCIGDSCNCKTCGNRLHLAKQHCQHTNTQFLQAKMAFLLPNQQYQSSEGKYDF